MVGSQRLAATAFDTSVNAEVPNPTCWRRSGAGYHQPLRNTTEREADSFVSRIEQRSE